MRPLFKQIWPSQSMSYVEGVNNVSGFGLHMLAMPAII